MKASRLFGPVVLIVGVSCAQAQLPAINSRAVVNGASFMAPGLPGGGIALGSVFTIFGRNLGPVSSPTLSFPLQTTLGGVSIKVVQGATSVAVIPLYVGPGQINAIMPSTAPLGMASLQVTVNNAASNSAPVRIVNNSVGLFSANQTGSGPGVLYNFDPNNPHLVNNLVTAAKPGQVITMWASGLGPISSSDAGTPPTGNLPTQVEVFVGGQAATVQYSGRSSCCAGVDQINFVVPANTPSGCWVPVLVRTGGVTVSNAVTMAVSADGKPCSEPSNPMAAALINSGSTARALAARIMVHHDVGVANTNDTIADVSSAYIAQETSGAFNFDPTVSLPPAGTCTAYTYRGDFPLDSGFPPGLPRSVPTGRLLDAGTVALGGASGGSNIALQEDPTGGMTFFGAAVPTISVAQSSLFLNPGNFTFLAAGGADVGIINAALSMPAPLTWTNRDQLQSVTLSEGFNVTWSGVAAGNSVFVSGGGVDLPANANSIFLCLANPGATSLTVPAYVLANVPPAHARMTQSRGVIYVGEWPVASPVQIAAQGLNSGVALAIELLGRTVMFQ